MLFQPASYMKNSSLKWKLFVSIITLIIIPLIAAAFIINTKSTEIVRKNTNEIAFETLKRTDLNVSRIISGVHEISLSIISDRNIQELLKSYAGNDGETLSPTLSVNRADTQQRLLELYDIYRNKQNNEDLARKFGFASKLFPLYQSMPFIDSISISKNGTIVNQFGDILYKEDMNFFKEASDLKGRRYWTNAYELTNRSALTEAYPVISLIRVINDLNSGRELGMERISVREEILCEAYSNINSWEGGEAHIINAEGVIISSTDKSQLNKQYEENIYERAFLGNREGYFESSINGNANWIFYYRIKELNWIVLQSIPADQLSIQLNAMNLIIMISIMFCLFFGVLFSILLNMWVVKPLMSLSREMEKVKNGDFHVRIKSRSTDEIGSVISQFVDMSEKVKDLIDEVYTSQIKEKEAELSAMQAQINPHFLYNTLDNIRWTALKEGASSAGEQIETLSNLFRLILSNKGEVTTIGEEIRHLEYYISIQKNRFKDRLHVEIDLDEALKDYNTIKLMLQPILENSIEHGFKKKLDTGIVHIRIEKKGEYIRFAIRDNGLGTDEKRVNEILNNHAEYRGFSALRNIKERLVLQYGENGDLTFQSIPGESTMVTITIPAILPGEGDQ